MTIAAAGGPDVFQQALVYLGAAVIAVPIATRIGLGSVLGYLLAGVVVGPAGFDLVGNSEEVMHFAEFGVVMMLFLIGMELQPKVLWRMRSSVLGLGGLQVALTVVVVAAIAMGLGSTTREGLAVGAILALSSTAIVMQSLSERGLTNTEGGRNAFSILLFQDIAVIPILALMPLLVPPGSAGPAETAQGIKALPGWIQFSAILGTVAGVILVGRVLVRPLLRAIAGTRLRELFTATALLLVVGISVAMTSVGLSPALGTFLAGVVLADSEYRHELEGDIEPFKGLLLGLFFISVGAGIDFGLVQSQPLSVGALVLSLIVVKALILFALTTAWRLKMPQRWTVALALPQAGEFAFVLLATTGTLNVLPDETSRMLVVVVALSMAITPLLLVLNERVIRPRFAHEGVERQADDPSSHHAPVVIAGFGRFGQIVGRLLRANGLQTTVLDLDARSIDVLREHGMTVFYGDAARPELLEAAGCGEAQLFVLAVDDAEHSHVIAETVRRHYPELHIVARARDTRAAHDLRGLGVQATVCEATGSGLEMGEAVLRMLGFDPYRALRATRRFRVHEHETQQQLFEAWGNASQTLQVARARVADLDRLLDVDEQQPVAQIDRSWESSPVVEEARD